MPAWLKRKSVWIPGALAAALGLYAAIGYLWAPSLVRDLIVDKGSELTGVPVSVGEVVTDPFTFELTLHDLKVADPAQPMLALDRLYVDFELSSLWKRAWVFQTVRLVGPYAHAVVRADGSLNLADLVPASDDAADSGLPAVSIGTLDVVAGRVTYLNEGWRRPAEKVLAPVEFELKDFHTQLDGGGFALKAAGEGGMRLGLEGQLSLQPMASQGRFSIEGLKVASFWDFVGDGFGFALDRGELDLAGDYAIGLDDTLRFDATVPTVTGRGIGVRALGEETDWVELPAMTVQGSRLSWAAGTLDIDSVTLDDASLQAWLAADGSINLLAMLDPPAAARAEEAAAEAAEDATEPPPPAPGGAPPVAPAVEAAAQSPSEAIGDAAPDWQVRIARFEMANATLHAEDRTLSPAVAFTVAPLSVVATGATLDPTQPIPLVVSGTLDGAATFRAEGPFTPDPMAAELQVEMAGLPLATLKPYVHDLAEADITAGTAAAKGLAVVAPPGRAPWLRFTGEASVDGFRSVDRAQKEELVSWRRLELAGIEAEVEPLSLHIAKATAKQPYLRAVIAPDESINLVRVFETPGAAPAADEPLPPVRIDDIRLQAATMSFADHFIQPNFAAKVESLDGSIRGLSSDPRSHAKVSLDGYVVNRYSPVKIRGELNPFRFDHYTDLQLSFSDIDLPLFNPYSGRFAGYAIAKGKLTTELEYAIRDRQLEAKHHVVVDQLEWGEATESQDKVSLPVRLGTSLLKDSDGVIDLDLPVTGSLDDPKFRVGPVIWQIVKNIIVKAVSAPFKLLGSLFQGAEDAQFVNFAPGVASLDEAQQAKLGELAKALVARPQLRIEVPAGLVPALDAEALANRRFQAALAALNKTPDDPDFALSALEPDDQVDLLRDLYKAQFGSRPKIPDAPEPPEDADRATRKGLEAEHEIAWLTGELMPKFAAPAEDVQALGQARAQAIQSALLANPELEPARVFVTSARTLEPAEGQVRIELKLE